MAKIIDPSAVLVFEPTSAEELTLDKSIGYKNNLINSGVTYLDGAKFVRAEGDYLYKPHYALSEGFPGTTGYTDLAVYCEFTLASLPSASVFALASKYDGIANKRTWALWYYENSGTRYLVFRQGHTNGTNLEQKVIYTGNLSLSSKYKIAVSYDNSEKSGFYKLWDASDSVVAESAFTVSNYLSPADAYFGVGQSYENNAPNNRFDGIIHSLVIFNTPKTEADFDSMAAGTYKGDIPAAITARLNSPIIRGLFYLVRITMPDGEVYYFSERGITYDSNTYLPSLLSISSLPQGNSSKDTVTITFANVDEYFTTLDRQKSFLGSKVEVLEYFDELDEARTRWVGFADELTEITDTAAVLNVFSGISTLKSEAPKRAVTPNCPWAFGVTNFASGANEALETDGSECPYQRSSGIGFKTTTSGAIDDSTDPVTFSVSALADSQQFKIDDEIQIDDEILRVYLVNSATSITCIRAVRGTSIASHTSGATVKFANCQYNIEACRRRGMFGNNTGDTFIAGSNTYNANYYGGFPVILGPQIPIGTSKYRAALSKFYGAATKAAFTGNEGIYGSELPLVYGKCMLSDPLLLLAKPEGVAPGDNRFVGYLFAVCEGLLATNATDASQSVALAAYETATDGYEAIYINGARRHDLRDGVGLWISNGYSKQPPPPVSGAAYITREHLGFYNTAILKVTVKEASNASGSDSVDVNTGVTGAFFIKYGRCVRVYSDVDTYVFKAAVAPGDVLLDFETSRRSGGGLDHSRFDIQAFIDLNTYCNETVTSTYDGSSVKRWTFNGAISGKKAFDEHERMLCLSFYTIPPFINDEGKFTIKPLKAESLTDLPIFSSISGTSRNILSSENGESSLKKKRKSLLDIPNEVKVNFMNYEASTKSWIKTQLVLVDREAQTRIGEVANDGSRRSISKTVDLPGVISIDEAARIGTLILRAGEFAEGGLSNNLIIEFDTFYKDSTSISKGDIIRVEDSKLDPVEELYFRVVDIVDEEEHVEEGGIVFKRHFVCTLHDNSIYDDTAYTCSEITRLVGIPGYNAEAPPVTDLEITEESVLDKYGNPRSKITFFYTEPGEHIVAVNNSGGYSAGATEIAIDSIVDLEEITANDLVRINGLEYTIESATDIVSGACTITLGYGLAAAIADDDEFSVLVRSERGAFKSVVIQRSTTDGNNNPVGDWRFVEELTTSGTSVIYNITNKYECFTAISKNIAGGVPDADTKDELGNYKYPRETILVDGATDGGNPTGSANLSVITAADDSKIPPYHAVFQIDKDTDNEENLKGMAVWMHTGTVGEGPFSAERTANPSIIIESGTCILVAGSSYVAVAGRSADSDVLKRVLYVYSDDGTPDSDLDGEIIKDEGAGYIETQGQFLRSGTFKYVVIKRFWDIGIDTNNSFYRWFDIKELEGGVQDVWRTPPVALPQGEFYVTACTLNPYGLGPRLTAGPILIAYEGTVTTDNDNPSGCSGLTILTNDDDSSIPEGSMAFQFNRDTSNYESIIAAEIVLGTTTPFHGPYAAQRAAHPSDVILSGSDLVVTAGSTAIAIASGTPDLCKNKALLIFETGDDKLHGQVIQADSGSALTLFTPFKRGGTFNYAVVELWWNLNEWERTFWVPQDFVNFSLHEATWRTIAVEMFTGTLYAQAYTVNAFGVSDA